MKRILSNIKYEYLLLVIAAGWALFFSFAIQLKPGYSFIGDDLSYVTAAKQLYLEHRLNDARPLLIAAINGFPLLFGYGESAVVKWSNAVNFCCWFLTALLIFRIISTRLTRKLAFLCAVFFVFCIGNLANAFNILAESIFISMLVLAVFLANKQFQTSDYKFTTLAFAVLILAILVKPLAMGLVFISALFYFKKRKAIILNKCSGFILVGLVLVFIQMYSMKKNYGNFTVSYIDAAAYYNYLGAKAYCLKEGIGYTPGLNERAVHFSHFSSHDQKEIAGADIIDQLQHNTLNLAKAYLYCMYSNSSKGSYIVGECKNDKQTAYFGTCHWLFKAICKIQNTALTVTGVLLSAYCLIRKKGAVFARMIAAMILYIFFVSAISCNQTDRFHIMFFPFVIILSALFFEEKRMKIQE